MQWLYRNMFHIVKLENCVCKTRMMPPCSACHRAMYITELSIINKYYFKELPASTYPTMQNCLKCLSLNGRNCIQTNSSFIKKPSCTFSICPQYVCKVWKRYIENYGRSWLHKLHTLLCKNCPKWLSSEDSNSVKINSNSIKTSHAHLQYIHNRNAKFSKDQLKTVGGVDYTNTIPYTAKKKCRKWLSSKGQNSVKIYSSSIKTPHAHLQYVHNKYASLKKIHWKLWEELITQTPYPSMRKIAQND